MMPDSYQKNRVADCLRHRIVAGEWLPGDRLPTRTQLIRQLETSALTLQQAMDHLQQEGFTVSQGSRGTFVADSPPYLHRYALCLYNSADHERRAYPFLASLVNEVGQFFHSGPSRIRVYDNLKLGSENLRRLQADAAAHRIAGLILTSLWDPLEGLDVPNSPRVPSVVISDPFIQDPRFPCVYPDLDGFLAASLECFRAQGRRRVGIFTGWPADHHSVDYLSHRFHDGGFDLDPALVQFATYAYPQVARNVSHLVMLLPEHRRPDALIIHDELFTDPVLRGIHDAGQRVGTDLAVVSHANFPMAGRDLDPITRIGFETRDILSACIKNIDRARRGEPVPQRVRIPAVTKSASQPNQRTPIQVPRRRNRWEDDPDGDPNARLETQTLPRDVATGPLSEPSSRRSSDRWASSST